MGRYAELIKASEEMAGEGSLPRSKELMNEAIALKEEVDALKLRHTTDFAGEDICEVCGVKYPLGGGGADWHDKESHKAGKTHTGFSKIRAKIIELRGKREIWEQYGESKRRKLKEEEKERERKK